MKIENYKGKVVIYKTGMNMHITKFLKQAKTPNSKNIELTNLPNLEFRMKLAFSSSFTSRFQDLFPRYLILVLLPACVSLDVRHRLFIRLHFTVLLRLGESFIDRNHRYISVHLGLLDVGVTTDDASAGVGVALGLSHYNIAPMDNDVLKIRLCMRDAIVVNLEKQNPLPSDDASRAKYLDAAKRLEEGLYKMAMTKEEYLNLSTLESRLASLVKGRQLNNYDQQHANSSSLETTITTSPGVSGEPTMQDNENRDQCETEIAENLKSVSLER